MRLGLLRLPVILAALAAGQAVLGQDLGKKISYSAVARPVAKALDELSVISGVRLEASAETTGDIIVLRVKDTTIDAVMRRIASCLTAQWQKTDAGYRLIRPAGLAQKERQDQIARSTATFARYLQEVERTVQSRGAFTRATAQSIAIQLDDIYRRYPEGNFDPTMWSQVTSLSAKTPSARLANRIALTLDAAVIAALPTESRTVFSSNPTRMQRPLSEKATAMVADYVKEQQIWADEAAKAASARDARRNWSLGGMETSLGVPKTLLVAVTKNGNSAQLQVKLFDDKGALVGQSYVSLAPDYRKIAADLSKGGESAERKIAYSPLTAAFLDAVKPAFGVADPKPGSKPAPLDPKLREALLQPENMDPLAFAPSEGLLQIGEIRGENVVANLPDVLVVSFYWTNGQAASPKSFLLALNSMDMAVDESDGWLTAKPLDPAYARETRIDRRALGTLLRSLAKNGRLTLEERAAFAITTHGIHRDLLSGTIGQILTSSFAWTQDSAQLDLDKLYGLLTGSQIAAIRSPNGMSLRGLSPEQRPIVEYLTYNNEYSVQFQPPARAGAPDWSMQNLFWSGIYREPTESLPNGIPPDGFLKGTFVTNEVVFLGIQPNRNWRGGQAMSASDLANAVFQQEHEDLFPWMKQSGQEASFDSFRLGTQRQITLTFQYTESLSLTQMLRQNDPRGESLTMQQLPAAFRDEYQKAMANLVAMYKNVKPGQTAPAGTAGGKNIPPR